MQQLVKDAIQDWLTAIEWHWFVTFTSNVHRPADWHFSNADRLLGLLQKKFSPFHFQYAATCELTRDFVRHLHMGIRAISSIAGDNLGFILAHEYVRCGAVCFPRDWKSRQKSVGSTRGMIRYWQDKAADFHTVLRSEFYVLSEPAQLRLLRDMRLNVPMMVKAWYQGNYGLIADASPVRNNSGFVAYMLKYILKSYSERYFDWMISDQHLARQLELFKNE